MAKLTNKKHEMFCIEYLLDLNATRAYQRTYGNSKGINASASKLLSNAKVKARIAELMADREAKSEIKSFDVVEKLKQIANVSIADIFNFEDGYLTVKNFEDVPKEALYAIESIETVALAGDIENVVTKIKFNSKIKSLEMLGRHFGLFNDTLNIELPQTIEQLIRSKDKTK